MIKGHGWIKENGCGCKLKGLHWEYAEQRFLCEQLLKDGVLAYPIDNFGRFNTVSRLVTLAVALALYDAQIPYAQGRKQDIGIVGMSPDGALAGNREYFRDYVNAGRKLGRANLFIYTLASSPLAEAAIHFGLQGPLLYMRHSDGRPSGAQDDNREKSDGHLMLRAQTMLLNNEAKTMLAVVFDTDGAGCFVVQG